MLTHQIKFQKTAVASASSLSDEDDEWAQWPYVGDNRQAPHHGILTQTFYKRFDKLGYAQYLNRLNVKIGDILIWHDCSLQHLDNLELYRFNVVEGFQELHMHAEYSGDYLPRCILIRCITAGAAQNSTPYYSSAHHWIVVPEDKVPEAVKAKYADMVNQIKPN